MYNPMTNGNVMSHSSQMRQFYTQRSNNSQTQQQQLQQQHQIPQQQQIITTPLTQQSYSGHLLFNQHTTAQRIKEFWACCNCSALRNYCLIVP
ncbi:unnamed protein product [Macrosiphum euphorbiae]|uniref:Uncharacterized protein n=1 Tax=Macrosiphum euphorbiae TaxID=13131 RepID=A0AAV0Y5U4_9HEMI|nr:unnamed protein product [Macrosiphum euphorbiae]